jgi:hypothetical protein
MVEGFKENGTKVNVMALEKSYFRQAPRNMDFGSTTKEKMGHKQ